MIFSALGFCCWWVLSPKHFCSQLLDRHLTRHVVQPRLARELVKLVVPEAYTEYRLATDTEVLETSTRALMNVKKDEKTILGP